jgi:hypothetical protein
MAMYQSHRSFASPQERTNKPEVLGPVHSPTSPVDLLQTELNCCSIIDISQDDDDEKEDEISLTGAETSCSSRSSTRRLRGSILKSSSCCSSNSNGGGAHTKKRISFFLEDQVFSISKYDNYDDMFYDEEALADFRYEALLWEAGMIDDDGDPFDLSIPTGTNENNLDDERSLDFDDLLSQDDNDDEDDDDDIFGNHSFNNHNLEDQEEAQANNHASIRAMKNSQWRSTQTLFYDNEDNEDSDEEEEVEDNAKEMLQRQEAARRKMAFRQSQEQLQKSFRKSHQYTNRRKYDGRSRRISFEMSRSILKTKMEKVVNNNKSKCHRISPTSQDDADTQEDLDIQNNSNNSSSGALSVSSEVSREIKRARIQSKMFALQKRISSRSLQSVLQDSDDHDNVKVKSSLIAKHNMYSPRLTDKNSSASVSADEKYKMRIPDMQDDSSDEWMDGRIHPSSIHR